MKFQDRIKRGWSLPFFPKRVSSTVYAQGLLAKIITVMQRTNTKI
ncbi:hypothetical protein NC652_013279 [Populus alba x Populus x berolinensis]|nr:hypothetical protein NC652_013279 [Populus alba x Populus x berolinensis]